MYYVFFSCTRDPRVLHSFPTRRSSDLIGQTVVADGAAQTSACLQRHRLIGTGAYERGLVGQRRSRSDRSEEHTSELQSRENLVCRLLLEKKKKNNISSNRTIRRSSEIT